ncbi:prepilin-type N-terminal cleavage/methylation domain-containing protein [Rubinisphaera sp.]|uniref:prepilin-type N-terminal cleavage/methylation domain-containing protein n=1 Tax=Rubinisphaera sp. TaxID=2024857 RepID=UPI000C117308|nr:prepilin-type N-terminal cleavage/methylation domain-containing protein [Rubinisphaera sp.]MBV10084.1 hypothetical protein [Rubinisphaera sp.]
MKYTLPSTIRSKAGFTLLELVLAAALTSLVLLGISGLIFIVYQVESESGQSVHLAQTGRNLLRQLEWDLQSIAGELPATVTESSSSTTNDAGSILALDEDQSTLDFDEAVESTAVSKFLLGDAVSLQFLAQPVLRTGRQFSLEIDPLEVSNIAKRQQRLLTWGYNTSETLELTLEGFDPEQPLVRAESLTDAELSTQSWLDALAVPELVEMQFMYFDGESWLEEWDSDLDGGLPTAIEVTVVLQSVGNETAAPFTMSKTIALPTVRFAAAVSAESGL